MKDSLLWSVRRKDSSRTHYLFGTMHVKNENAYHHNDKVLDFISKCSAYIGEMNLNDPDLENLHQYFLLEDGVLPDLMSPKKYQKTRKAIILGFGVDIDELMYYKPLIISNMLAEAVLTKEYNVALDHFLWTCAVDMDKKCYGLESAKDQYRTLVKIPFKYQLKSLFECSNDTAKFKKKVLKLSKYYQEGRLTALYKTTYKSMGELRGLMIFDRNRIMAERLVDFFQNDTCFCSVGAAHLAGEKGIIALLKKQGYMVKPI